MQRKESEVEKKFYQNKHKIGKLKILKLENQSIN